MKEERYFKIECKFSFPGRTDSVDISVNMMDHILRDLKVSDSKLMETESSSYSMKTFGNMPRLLQRIFFKINSENINTDVGFEFKVDNDAGEEDQFDYFSEGPSQNTHAAPQSSFDSAAKKVCSIDQLGQQFSTQST